MNNLGMFSGQHVAIGVSVLRGTVVESRHEVEAVIATATGQIVASWGYDEKRLVPLRSTAKLAQALPVLESGAARQFDLNASQLAIMCASHRGHESHIDVLVSLFSKLNVAGEETLVLPPSRPLDVAAADARLRNGQSFTRLCHMCAGNHAAFICSALHAHEPVHGYHDAGHPAQQRARDAIATMVGMLPQQMHLVPDGCGIPSYAVPLAAIAAMAARIANPASLPEPRREAVEVLYRAAQLHPDLLSAHDTAEAAILALGRGDFYVKGGAEGVILLADRNSGYGLALKCRDGETRGTLAALGAFVGALCELAPGHALWHKTQPPVMNALGQQVGTIFVEGL